MALQPRVIQGQRRGHCNEHGAFAQWEDTSSVMVEEVSRRQDHRWLCESRS